MLKDRILFTLKFFDLQNSPLTLSELGAFLFNEPEGLKANLNSEFEITNQSDLPSRASLDQIKSSIENELADSVEHDRGFYCLTGRSQLISDHFDNLIYRQKREKIIK